MNLCADEGVDRGIVERLRAEGHLVLYVAEMNPGIDDDLILGRANDEDMLLVTYDKDFGELVFRQNRLHAGVVLLRIGGLLAKMKADLVASVLREHQSELQDGFTVVSPGTVRNPQAQRLEVADHTGPLATLTSRDDHPQLAPTWAP